MELYPILYFVTVARTGNLTQAAKQLMISPPALSNALRRLEEKLGVPLFDRAGRGLTLNRFGEAYLPWAEQLLEVNRGGLDALAALKEEEDRRLSIADTTHAYASHLISEFLQLHPGISLRRVYVEPEDCRSIDLEKAYDLAIGSTNAIDRPELCSLQLRAGHAISAIVHRSHPLAKRASVTLEELSALPMIAYAEGQPGRRMLTRLFAPLGAAPSVIYEGNTPSAMAPALARNLGVLLQPDHTARFNMRFYPDCEAVPVTDVRYEANTTLFWSAARPQSPAARQFCAFCREYCAREAEKERD